MYVIRADGNAKIGAGHLMRCLTIAEALAQKLGDKRQICFVCADALSAAMVENAGFSVKVFDTDYRDMESELPKWNKLFQQKELQLSDCHVILVDSYHVTDAYLKQLRSFGKVCLMDDLQEHAYPVDMVINYNAFAEESIYCRLYGDTHTEYVIGSAYVPVRQQFFNRKYTVTETVKNVLITTGGGDQDNIAGTILKTIYGEDMDFHIVTGRYNPHWEGLKEMERTLPGIHVYHNVSNMASLMGKCDMAVTAGGTTIYELASIGVPFLCFSYAENQEALTEYIGRNQIAGFLGAYHLHRETVFQKLQELFGQFCNSYELRKACYRKEREMIDGKGAQRLAEKLI